MNVLPYTHEYVIINIQLDGKVYVTCDQGVDVGVGEGREGRDEVISFHPLLKHLGETVDVVRVDVEVVPAEPSEYNQHHFLPCALPETGQEEEGQEAPPRHGGRRRWWCWCQTLDKETLGCV